MCLGAGTALFPMYALSPQFGLERAGSFSVPESLNSPLQPPVPRASVQGVQQPLPAHAVVSGPPKDWYKQPGAPYRPPLSSVQQQPAAAGPLRPVPKPSTVTIGGPAPTLQVLRAAEEALLASDCCFQGTSMLAYHVPAARYPTARLVSVLCVPPAVSAARACACLRSFCFALV